MEKAYYVYILTNASSTVLYTGFTSDLVRRLFEHRNKLIEGFTMKYRADRLVYFECYEDVWEALAREKEIKAWRREKKERLIRTMNPSWKDLSGVM